MEFDVAFAWSIMPELFQGLLVTVQVVVLGFLLAVLLGLILALALRSQVRLVHYLSKAYLSFFRNTPLMVQLYVLFFALPLAGVAFPAITTGVIGPGAITRLTLPRLVAAQSKISLPGNGKRRVRWTSTGATPGDASFCRRR